MGQNPRKKPERVRHRSVSIPLYPHKNGWRFAWPDKSVKGGWRYGTRRTKKEAKAAAHARAVELANQQPDLGGLDSHQTRLVAAFLEMGPTFDDLALLQNLKAQQHIRLVAAIDRFMGEKLATKGKRTHHLDVLDHDLRCLAGALGDCRLVAISSQEIGTWLDGLDVGAKRRNDYRAAAVALWRWAAKNDLIPAARFTAPEKIPVLPTPHFTVKIFTPAELRFLLGVVSPKYLPWLVLNAFSGLRSGEIRADHKPPLIWERIHRDRGIIEIPPEQSKTGRRKLVPILPTLGAWLDVFGTRHGPVIHRPAYRTETRRLGDLLDREFRRLDGWPDNAPRHSYGSHRVAEIRDIPAVSLEMDNSPAIIRRHYLEAVTREQAEEYFGIHPGSIGR